MPEFTGSISTTIEVIINAKNKKEAVLFFDDLYLNISIENDRNREIEIVSDNLGLIENNWEIKERSDNQLKTNNELSFSEKTQVALVDMLLSEAVITTEAFTLSDEVDNLKNQLTVLNETITQLSVRVYKLEEENKQLKNNQLEVETKSEPKPKPEPKLTDNKAKKPKFKLPEDFVGYQQECDDLIGALSCFYNIKKGKWGKDILQFILTPADTTKHPCSDKWKAGLYLHPGQWTVDKVNLSDPDEWSDWFMDIYDFADANDIEIS